MSEISQKQLEANRENAEKSTGPKTENGKAVSKYNAVKHGILKEVVSDYEQGFYEDTVGRLNDHFNPVGVLEKMLVDRIGIYYIKLYRVAKAENEYMQSALNPRKVIVRDKMNIGLDLIETIIENEGYTPKINQDAVGMLSDTYLRYETSIENRLYKALRELEKIQSIRKGERTPSPAEDLDDE